MSSKLLMTGGIAERRVRPLWDAIDSRQYKTALKLATSLLAKNPDSPYIQTLKALVLESMGKPDEALPLCIKAKDAGPVDDLTLSTLQIIFQRLDRLDIATSCYEYACAKLPNNLELMLRLFDCYVREYSYVKQQQTAMKMYKLVSEERFLLWAVCSIQLQVSCGNGGKKLLSLAEALLKKHIDSHGLHELEALLAYISILEQQGKYQAALDVLGGNLGRLFSIETDRLKIQGKLLVSGHEYAAATKVFRDVLESCSDDWEIFLQYLDCSLKNSSTSKSCLESLDDQYHNMSDTVLYSCLSTHLTEEDFDRCISDVQSFIANLQQMMEVYECKRGPLLANLEIERCRILFGKADMGELMQAFEDYYKRFGHLASFISDVEKFLQYVDLPQRPILLKKLHDTCSQLSSVDKVKGLGRAIAIFQVEESFGMSFSASDDDCVAHAKNLAKIYIDNLNLSKGLDTQESMHGEELLTMIGNILMQLFWRTQHPGYLLEAIMVLEFGLSIRRYIWQYRLMLVHMYTYWAGTLLAFEWYRSLDIKNILLESMSHHIFPQLLSSPFWSDSYGLMKEYLKFHEDFMKEAADHTVLVYRHCNYSKVLEFVKFRERLENSYHYLLVRIEQSILQIKEKADNLEEAENILAKLNSGIEMLQLSEENHLDHLSFNEDLQTRPWWSPAPDECYLSGPFEGEVNYRKQNLEDQHLKRKRLQTNIQRRCLLPRIVWLSTQCVSLRDAEEGKTHDTEGLCAELHRLLVRYAGTVGFSFDEALGILSKIASEEKTFKELNLDIVDWTTLAVFYNAWKLVAGFMTKEECSFDSSINVDNLMRLSIKEITESSVCFQPGTYDCSVKAIPAGTLVPTLTRLLTEPFTWHGLIIQSCFRSKLPAGRKKKRGSAVGSQVDGAPSSIYGVLQNSIASFKSTIEGLVFWLGGYLDTSEEQEADLFLSFFEGRDEAELNPAGKVSARPGCVLKLLETSSSMSSELGPRIGQAVETWNANTVARKIAQSHHGVVSLLHNLCTSKLKMLKAMKISVKYE